MAGFPGHRVEVQPDRHHLRISLHGELLADSSDAVALVESHMPTRWYLPREGVKAELLDSDTHSHCPFKGDASYLSVRLSDGEVADDLVWYYPEPKRGVAGIEGLLCFYTERVEVELDGEPQPRPS